MVNVHARKSYDMQKGPLISLVLVLPNDDDVECIEFISRIVTPWTNMDGKS